MQELAGARPSLVSMLRSITTPVLHPPRTVPSPTAQTRPPPKVSTSETWQQDWVDANSASPDTSPVYHLVLHPLVPAVRAHLRNGAWSLEDFTASPDDGPIHANTVTIDSLTLNVVVAPSPAVPAAALNTAWVMSGNNQPWGHPVAPPLRLVLDSLNESKHVPPWTAQWTVANRHHLASILVFGPYDPLVGDYGEAEAVAAPDDSVLLVAIEPLSSETVALGFTGMNRPSTQ
jgi:hypothetical protein